MRSTSAWQTPRYPTFPSPKTCQILDAGHYHPTTPLHRLLNHHADLLDPHDTRRLTALLHDTDILAVRHHIIDIQANLIELARRRGTVQPRARTTATYLSRRKIHPPTTRAKSDESTTPPTRAT